MTISEEHKLLTIYEMIAARLAQQGLAARGGFQAEPGETVPGSASRLPRSIVMVGNVGGEMWSQFSADRPQGTDPLNRWTETVISEIAAEFGAHPVYPWTRPYLPFQQWAMRAEPAAVSPIQLLIHPEHGLWHAYRAALLFDDELELPLPDERPSPCEICEDQPCLKACPVGAFTFAGYDLDACTRHIAKPQSQQRCLTTGCLARNACPVGVPYSSEQIRFHTAAFYDSRVSRK